MTDSKGTYRKYADFNFSAERLQLIRQAAQISDQYESDGFAMTLRQLYYQMVARNLIENNKGTYDRLGSAVSDGRLAGLISWTALEDRTRRLLGYQTYDNPAEAIRSSASNYRLDKWAGQRFRPEVWVEKEALIGVIGDICSKLEVDFFACKGYNSQSEQWRAGRRFARYIQQGQTPIVFHLGDHDPSGLDMTRDNRDRLSMFAGVDVLVVRLALNMDQIRQWNPPPNYAKPSDSRYGDYQREYGDECWELDALAPPVIHDLIRGAIKPLRDEKMWDEMKAQETEDIRLIEQTADDLNFDEGTPD